MHLSGAHPEPGAPPRADGEIGGDDDLRDRGLIPFAMWLFARRHPWRFDTSSNAPQAGAPGAGAATSAPGSAHLPRYGLADAQAKPPVDRLAQLVAAQQSVAIRSHGSPAAAQRTLPGGGIVASSATHALAPEGPPQAPLQQSSPALHAAPSGAQLP